MRRYTLTDRLIGSLEQGLTFLCTPSQATRPSPALRYPEAELSPKQIRQQIALMRINHAGEIAAQGLYQGQALTAQWAHTRAHMEQAAKEEIDHLAWCQERLQELGGRSSYGDPLWYFGALFIGAVAGIAGDRWSLGFIAETENQVSAHLANHLMRSAKEDEKTQRILMQMKTDEEQHATQAIEAGAASLPKPIQWLMKLTAKFMVCTAYYL